MDNQSKARFSSRAPYYHQFRPRYPRALVDLLHERIGFTPAWTVADIGAGTGISSELFLNHGCRVYAVEPNPEMRAVAAQNYGTRQGFTLVSGSAEATTLPDAVVNLVVAGQAFHWFQREMARAEFQRILKPDGWLVLFWNERPDNVSPFGDALNELMRRHDIEKWENTLSTQAIMDKNRDFFERDFFYATIDNTQALTYPQLEGRMVSSSYMPLPGTPEYEGMVHDLRAIFHAHQQEARVTVPYTTLIYAGRLA